jgi:streptogramin lyase
MKRALGSLACAVVLSLAACAQDDAGEPSGAGPTSATEDTEVPAAPVEIATETGPNFLVVSGDHIWVGETRAGKLAQIDPATDTVIAQIELGEDPTFLTASGADVWISSIEGRSLWRIDTTRVEVAEQIRLPKGGFGMEAGLGSLWVALREGNVVLELDPKTLKTRSELEVDEPEDVAVAFGRVWVASASTNSVVMIDPATGAKDEVIVDGGVHSIAAGADAIWVGSGDAGDAITKIESDGSVAGSVETEEGAFPDQIAFSDGLVWVAQYNISELLGVDPVSLEIVRRIETGLGAAVPVAAFGSLWVANFWDDTVWRLDSN